jgi:methylaspartate ammonia-lyase
MLSKLAEVHNSRGDRPSAQLIQYAIQQLKVAQAACAQRATAGSVRQTEPETEPTTKPVSAASVSKEWVLLLQRSAQLSTVMLKEVRSLRHAVLVNAVVVRTGTVGAHRY